jgi:hypothetical protein
LKCLKHGMSKGYNVWLVCDDSQFKPHPLGFVHNIYHYMGVVATLALGSWPRQRFVRVRAKREAWESNLMFPGVYESVKEWTLTLPSDLPLWELESRWSPDGVPMDFQIFKKQLQGSKPIRVRSFLYQWKALGT